MNDKLHLLISTGKQGDTWFIVSNTRVEWVEMKTLFYTFSDALNYMLYYTIKIIDSSPS